MKKLIVLLMTVLCAGLSVGLAQDYPHVTIRQVQEVSDSLLNLGQTDSPRLGDTLWVRGVVATAPRMADGRGLWFTGNRWRFVMKDPTDSIFNHITVVASDTTYFRDNVGLDQLAVGDSVEIMGYITEFRTLTQLEVVPRDTVLKLHGTSAASITAKKMAVSDFFSGTTKKNIPAEYHESAFIRFENLTVISTAGAEFTVSDASGNQIIVDDQSNAIFTVTPPSAGAKIGFVQGYIFTNGVLNWTVNPRNTGDYSVLGFAPTITSLGRLDSLPGPSTAVRLRAQIIDNDGSIASAKVYYKVNNGPTNSMALTSGADSIWSATIPAVGVDSAFVSYYYEAVDDSGVVATDPTDTTKARHFYLSLNRMPGIRDIQYNPYGGGSSYDGYRLSVTGIATSARTDFGAIFVQDGTGPWSGIRINSTQDTSVRRGQNLTVTGRIRDLFTQTVVDSATIVTNSSNNPLPLATNVLAARVLTGGPDAEAYESVLIQLRNVYVVNLNEDAVSNSNFGEFGMSEDSTKTSGLRVDDYSLLLPYTNDTTRAGQSGKIQLRKKDFFQSMRGVLFYSFSHFKLVPRDSADFTGYNMAPLSVERISQIPGSYALSQNYPNPFNPETTIDYILPISGKVSLKIYNLLGQVVATVVDDIQDAGSYRVRLDRQVLGGFSSGVYFYQLHAGEFVQAKKMLLLR